MLSRRSFLKYLSVAPVAAPLVAKGLADEAKKQRVADVMNKLIGWQFKGNAPFKVKVNNGKCIPSKSKDSYYEQLMDVFDDGWYWADSKAQRLKRRV